MLLIFVALKESACLSQRDCNMGGECSADKLTCICDPTFTGPFCEHVALVPAKRCNGTLLPAPPRQRARPQPGRLRARRRGCHRCCGRQRATRGDGSRRSLRAPARSHARWWVRRPPTSRLTGGSASGGSGSSWSADGCRKALSPLHCRPRRMRRCGCSRAGCPSRSPSPTLGQRLGSVPVPAGRFVFACWVRARKRTLSQWSAGWSCACWQGLLVRASP